MAVEMAIPGAGMLKATRHLGDINELTDATKIYGRAASGRVDDVLGGLSRGKNSHVQTVGSDAKLGEIYSALTRGGSLLSRPGYRGSWMQRTDGVQIGMRESSRSGGRTIDILFPDGTTRKVHIE
ncbi:hypothetical protein [Sanguibacter sp. Leaf3]|uniref:hypothetical protein n=1 Tax=Sanguibacter sp. Leaf3 TaxID=1736209 RepID=UPI001F2EFDF4|nr:hypothetical protein [Sanguibacter sp. Leaf3]